MNAVLIPWVIASTLLLFFGAYWIYMLEKRFQTIEARYKKILALAEETDQATVVQFLTRLDGQNTKLQNLQSAVAQLTGVTSHVIQGYSVIRYSAYENVGGDQSFSVALVDGTGTGIMLSGLNTRDETRVYAKPLVQWRSSYTLSAEEQQALGQARQVSEGKAPPRAGTESEV
ncbi:MAG: DUF4446 family protein [Anaerolineae bacterium]|nr:DUF4446 family protein [Anaerolineae bacterium]